MYPTFQNKFFKIASIILIAIVVIFFILIFIANNLNDARSGPTGFAMDAPSSGMGMGMELNNYDSASPTYRQTESSYYPPQPNPTDYTKGLESYETTTYNLGGRIKQFDEFCDALNFLKADSQIHFKSITTSTNNCQAMFYVNKNKAIETLNTISNYSGIEVNRNTTSVTRHRAQLQSQTAIIQQQLASVMKSLSTAETQFDEIAEFSRQTNNATELSKAIREKLTLIDTLTQRKISLTSQLDRLYQEASDLEERLNVVAFYVNVNRSYPQNVNEQSQKWEQAWYNLKNQYTNTLIAITALFSVFILRVVIILVYALVIIVALRGLWKFVKLVWNKW